MISQTSRQALAVLGHLVARGDGRAPAEHVAAEARLAATDVLRVLTALREAGVVDGQKGWGGGYRVVPEALGLPVREIVALFDGAEAIHRTDCAFGLPDCDEAAPCPLHGHWTRILDAFHAMIETVTVGDLGPGGVLPTRDRRP